MIVTSFYFTKAGIVIPTVIGSVSFISSAIVISIILRSSTGIRSTYHRIILSLSASDSLVSLAIALTTIPMPREVIYPFEMPSYGNVKTCKIQGISYITGNAVMFIMNCSLYVYYLCTIRFKMREQTFRCYLEFPLYALSIVISLTLPTILSRSDLINPSPTDPFCIPNSYPLNCTKDENLECRGMGVGRDDFVTLSLLFIYLAFLTLVATMSLILHSSFRDERRLGLQRVSRDNAITSDNNCDDESIQAELINEQKRAIIWQALMYVTSFVLCTIFTLIEIYTSSTTRTSGPQELNNAKNTLSVLRMIFQPLRGFFVLAIFAYHKVLMLLQSDADLNVAEALEIVLFRPFEMNNDDAIVFNNIDIVSADFSRKWLDAIRTKSLQRNDIEEAEETPSFGSHNANKCDSSVGDISSLQSE